MRDYGRIMSSFWTGDTGRKMRGDPACQTLAAYLLSAPLSAMTGIYYLPLVTITHETGLSADEVRRCFVRLEREMNWAMYDETRELVFVIRMVIYQVGESVKPPDKNSAGIRREVAKFRKHPFATAFYNLYAVSHQLVGYFPDLAAGGVTGRTGSTDTVEPASSALQPARSMESLGGASGRLEGVPSDPIRSETIRTEGVARAPAPTRTHEGHPDPPPPPPSGPRLQPPAQPPRQPSQEPPGEAFDPPDGRRAVEARPTRPRQPHPAQGRSYAPEGSPNIEPVRVMLRDSRALSRLATVDFARQVAGFAETVNGGRLSLADILHTLGCADDKLSAPLNVGAMPLEVGDLSGRVIGFMLNARPGEGSAYDHQRNAGTGPTLPPPRLIKPPPSRTQLLLAAEDAAKGTS